MSFGLYEITNISSTRVSTQKLDFLIPKHISPSDELCFFQICHPHISSLDLAAQSFSVKGNPKLINCQMCKRNHPRNPLTDDEASTDQPIRRRRIVMGSSDFHNLWKCKSYKPEVHIDFDVIIGNDLG